MALKTLIVRSLQQKKLVNYTPIIIKCRKYSENEDRKSGRKKIAAVVFGSVLVGAAVSEISYGKKDTNKPNDNEIIEAGEKKPNLPTYSAEEVSKHDTMESFWVTYKQGVYDVTSFLASHPGGEQILNAAGLSIEPFWNVYGMHKTKEVYALLESYRIGNLRDEDVADHSDEEMWAREPARDPRLLVKTARPFNAETPMQLQVESFDTPNELFFVRQHMPVPDVDPKTHKLRVIIHGPKSKEVSFSMDDLAKFPQVSLRAALMCAGNRRSEMNKVKPVKGLSWQGGAIGNAVWSGVYLQDVLVHCGVDLNDTQGKHIILTGSDMDATGEKFNTSIPLSLVSGARVLLATAMNGAPLPRDHGRPLRALVPGAPAVRSVKWLESITVSEKESSSHWHQRDYRSFNPSTTWETADFAAAPPVYGLPVTAAVCRPADGDTVQATDGCIEVKGYAYSGGGAAVARVDVSADGGRSWRRAALLPAAAPAPAPAAATAPATAPAPADAPPQHYAWTLWSARLPAPAPPAEMEIWVKATDSNFNTQPENFDHIWNIRGILANAYHKIKIHVK